MTLDENTPFSPLDTPNIAESLVREVLSRTPHKITELEPFNGSGLYVIYYTGDHPAYRLLAEANADEQFSQPIYVGKAVPAGSRRGALEEELAKALTKPALYARIKQHRDSLVAADNLEADDFYVRYLVVEPLFIALGESLLISRFMPVWNRALDGFGNHDPGAGRRQQARSPWDTLHPGRSWAALLQHRPLTAEHHTQTVQEYLRQRIPVE